MKNNLLFIIYTSLLVILFSCNGSVKQETKSSDMKKFTGAKGEIKLMILDPGHFHAALVQKNMYDQVSPKVNVFAPEGPELEDYQNKIKGFNSRSLSPTTWEIITYQGNDFFEKMVIEKPGNVVVIAGNNQKKTEYIFKSIEAGINVLADKPMVIFPDKFDRLEKAFQIASVKGVLLYDIMTERYEITSILQKELAHNSLIFGEMQKGSIEEPGITKESVHHYNKIVAGSQVKRPGWFFDVEQQGDGLTDVSTHLVDLVQWECFPEQVLAKTDVEMLKAKRSSTSISKDEFKEVTQLDSFPEYLNKYKKGNKLEVIANGEMIYKLKGIHAKVIVEWKYKAPEGGGDTHLSIMRGTKCNLIIRQGKEQKYKPVLYVQYVEKGNPAEFETALKSIVYELKYDSLGVEKVKANEWMVTVPDKYRVGHEAHFTQVTEKFLKYLTEGKLPEWEVPNMIVKYFTTTKAYELSRM